MSARRWLSKTDDLEVECWCQHATVLIPSAEVKAGRTGSCGRTGCNPKEAA